MGILDDEDYRVINLDETALFLEMGFNTTIDFRGIKNIEIESTGKENYNLTILLTVCGDGTKFSSCYNLYGWARENNRNKYEKIIIYKE